MNDKNDGQFNEENMSPESSPGDLKNSGRGVKRLNKNPMVILISVVVIFVLIVGYGASKRQKTERSSDATSGGEIIMQDNGSSYAQASAILGKQREGIIVPSLPSPQTDSAALTQSAVSSPALDEQSSVSPGNFALGSPQGELQLEPPSPNRSGLSIDEIQRLRNDRLKMLSEASQARSGVDAASILAQPSTGSGTNGNTPRTRQEMIDRIAQVRREANQARYVDASSAYQQQVQEIRQQLDSGATAPSSANSMGLLANTDTNQAGAAPSDIGRVATSRWDLASHIAPPKSRYELIAGNTIPATMISGINSELPGQIAAQVSQDVYDTATGHHLLIPQGTQLVGEYSSDVAYGQSRVMVAWQRLVFPDGKTLDIGEMQGADQSGYSGFQDKVNNHYWRVFSSAFLMSGVVAGINVSQDNGGGDDDNGRNASSAMSEALGQVLGQTVAQMIQKNLNIAPTLEIRPGYRFHVVVTKDLVFSKPYESFDY